MDTHRGRRTILALASAVVALSSLSLPAARAAVTNVEEVGTSFQPSEIRIGVNDRVVWTNRSSQSHTVTFTGGPDLHPSCDPLLRLGCQGPGATVEHTFTSAGTFAYHCKIHPDSMRGTVVVASATTSSVTTSSTVAKSSSSTSTTQKATSSTTSTSRPLATSSTLAKPSSTTTTSQATSVLLPGDPPPFGDDTGSNAASRSRDSKGSDSGTVALIVALLLAVSVGGGFVLWRLRPGRA